MSIEKITDKIIRDAEEVKSLKLEDAKNQCDRILSEARAKADKMIEDMRTSGLDEKAKIIERRKSVSDIDSRKVQLGKKQELLDGCFDAAVERLINLPEDEYVDFLVNIGIASNMYGGVLTFNDRDRATVAEKVIEKLNKATEEKRIEKYGDTPYADRFSIREVTEPITGGYWIRYRMTYADNTVGSLVKLRKSLLASEVADILFKEG